MADIAVDKQPRAVWGEVGRQSIIVGQPLEQSRTTSSVEETVVIFGKLTENEEKRSEINSPRELPSVGKTVVIVKPTEFEEEISTKKDLKNDCNNEAVSQCDNKLSNESAIKNESVSKHNSDQTTLPVLQPYSVGDAMAVKNAWENELVEELSNTNEVQQIVGAPVIDEFNSVLSVIDIENQTTKSETGNRPNIENEAPSQPQNDFSIDKKDSNGNIEPAKQAKRIKADKVYQLLKEQQREEQLLSPEVQ